MGKRQLFFSPERPAAVGHQQSSDSLSLGWLLPDAFQPFIVGLSENTILNVCSHREQSFRRQNQHDGEGREAATSGHSRWAKKGDYYSLRLFEMTKIAVPLTVFVTSHAG